jgi:hypothetical protein
VIATVCSDTDISRAIDRVSLPVASRPSSSYSRVLRPKARPKSSTRSQTRILDLLPTGERLTAGSCLP